MAEELSLMEEQIESMTTENEETLEEEEEYLLTENMLENNIEEEEIIDEQELMEEDEEEIIEEQSEYFEIFEEEEQQPEEITKIAHKSIKLLENISQMDTEVKESIETVKLETRSVLSGMQSEKGSVAKLRPQMSTMDGKKEDYVPDDPLKVIIVKAKEERTPEEIETLYKALKRERRKRVPNETKRRWKRDHLTRELKYGELARQKLDKIWRKILTDAKMPLLKIEFQLAVNNIERLLDCKDFTISLLLDELDEAEEQYRMNLKSHCESIDNIYKIFQDRLNDLKLKYDMELHEMLEAAKKEIEERTEAQKNEEEYLNTMLYRLEIEAKDLDKVVKCEYLSNLNEQANKNMLDLQAKRGNLERLFMNLWSSFNEILTNYIKETEHKRKGYNILYTQDTFMRNKICEQTTQISDSFDSIRKLKEHQLNEKDALQNKIGELIKEKECFLAACNILKRKLKIDDTHDQHQLAFLVTESNKIINCLEKQVVTAESILNFVSICHKYETQKEKVLPFPQTEPKTQSSKSVSQHSEIQTVNFVKELEPFWQKCGQGDASRHLLNEEREFLKRKNVQLKRKILDNCANSSYSCKFPSIITNKTNVKHVLEAAYIMKNLEMYK